MAASHARRVAREKESEMAMPGNAVLGLALILLVALGVPRTADGQVPTAADFAACNAEASEAFKTGMASPTMSDHTRAARARAVTMTPTDVTGNLIQSSDPHIHGMEAEGAKQATYQAAYRSCMRRKGF
jgi:hypothetical protein